MKHRRYYRNRDPDKVPEEAGYKLDDLEERGTWWRDILPLRTFSDLWMHFEKQDPDVREAGQGLLGVFMSDPKERSPEIYKIYPRQAHRERRLDHGITWLLVTAAGILVSAAEEEIGRRKGSRDSLRAIKAAYDQFRLAHEVWIISETAEEDRGIPTFETLLNS